MKERPIKCRLCHEGWLSPHKAVITISTESEALPPRAITRGLPHRDRGDILRDDFLYPSTLNDLQARVILERLLLTTYPCQPLGCCSSTLQSNHSDSDSDPKDGFATRVSPHEQTSSESDGDVREVQPDNNSDNPNEATLFPRVRYYRRRSIKNKTSVSARDG
jgi:hypothetical protein